MQHNEGPVSDGMPLHFKFSSSLVNSPVPTCSKAQGPLHRLRGAQLGVSLAAPNEGP